VEPEMHGMIISMVMLCIDIRRLNIHIAVVISPTQTWVKRSDADLENDAFLNSPFRYFIAVRPHLVTQWWWV